MTLNINYLFNSNFRGCSKNYQDVLIQFATLVSVSLFLRNKGKRTYYQGINNSHSY